jgi:hypothetical protein
MADSLSGYDRYKAKVQVWLNGHADALAFIETLFTALHVWDDLEDRDRAVSSARFNQMMTSLLITLPRNRFYRDHFAELNPVVHLAILNWQIANRLEQSATQQDLQTAFILRSSYTDLITVCATILGGEAWGLTVGFESRRHSGGEGFDAYCAALRHEQHRDYLIEEPAHGV